MRIKKEVNRNCSFFRFAVCFLFDCLHSINRIAVRCNTNYFQMSVISVKNNNRTMQKAKLIFLHLLPGLITITLIVLAAPMLQRNHLHTGLAFLFAFLFVTIPVHIFLLLREGKNIHGFFSFKQVNRFSAKMPFWQYAVAFLLFIVLAFTLLYFLTPVNNYLAQHLFAWLPAYLQDNDFNQQLGFNTMLFFLVLQIIVDGILIPVVEEFYFKGYLLSRMTAFGVFAPLLNAFLFTLAHFWQPYNYLLIFSIQLPITYFVWWKKNVYIGILLHLFGNLFGAIAALLTFLNG